MPSKHYYFFSLVFSLAICFNSVLSAQVGIGTTIPADGAMLDIESTDKGVLVPRVDIADLGTIAPITPAATEGLLVWNTNATTGVGFHYWNGGAWVPIPGGTVSDDWTLAGNNITGTEFLGTLNANDLNIRTNNTERMRVFSTGQVSVNLPVLNFADDTFSAEGVFAVNGYSPSGGIGVYGDSQGASSVGVLGTSDVNIGVNGVGLFGVFGESPFFIGTWGEGAEAGVVGDDLGGNRIGVQGQTDAGDGVVGFAGTTGNGVVGQSDSGVGTIGQSIFNLGVFGISEADFGVQGQSTTSSGVFGIGGLDGVVGETLNPALGFGVFSVGDSGATGAKNFAIDHPLDPENKILKHASIESNEILNLYRGKESFNSEGKVIVTLPDYFEAVNNNNANYQLTPIGAAMPNLYIEKEVSNGTFVIAGGIPGKKVSWQLTVERDDPYLQQYPEKRNMEVDKDENRGKYLMPQLYGKSEELSIYDSSDKKRKAVKSGTRRKFDKSSVERQGNTSTAKDKKEQHIKSLSEQPKSNN